MSMKLVLAAFGLWADVIGLESDDVALGRQAAVFNRRHFSLFCLRQTPLSIPQN